MPEIIASFLTLPIHKECRGDRLLRSSTSSLADSGADFSTVTLVGGRRQLPRGRFTPLAKTKTKIASRTLEEKENMEASTNINNQALKVIC
jgi:hypothetical protein